MKKFPKIGYVSDIHTDHLPFSFGEDTSDVDIMVVAGDLGYPEVIVPLLSSLNKPVIIVLGNHDFWGEKTNLRTWEQTIAMWRKAVLGTNIHFLEKDSVEIDGVRFLGCTLWTGYANGNRDLMRTAVSVMNDFNFMGPVEEFSSGEGLEWMLSEDAKKEHVSDFFSYVGEPVLHPSMLEELHIRSKNWLAKSLSDGFDGPTVVVTHHAPSWESLRQFGVQEAAFDPKYWNAGRRGMDGVYRVASYADQTGLLKSADAWIHGHLHASFSYVEDGCLVLCNPRGYSPRDVWGHEPYKILDFNTPQDALEARSAALKLLDGTVEKAKQAESFLSLSLLKNDAAKEAGQIAAEKLVAEIWGKQVEAYRKLASIEFGGSLFQWAVGTHIPMSAFDKTGRDLKKAMSGGLSEQTQWVVDFISQTDFMVKWFRTRDRTEMEVPFADEKVARLWRIPTRDRSDRFYSHRDVFAKDIPAKISKQVISLMKKKMRPYEIDKFLASGGSVTEDVWFEFLKAVTFPEKRSSCACVTRVGNMF